MPEEYRYSVSATDGAGNPLPVTLSDVVGWPVTQGRYTEAWPPIDVEYPCTSIIYTYPPCRVYWGSHGCQHPRGHGADTPHECNCCTCAHHPDPDPDNFESAPSCVAAPPYYGSDTRFYGEDAEALGLPLVNAPSVTEE